MTKRFPTTHAKDAKDAKQSGILVLRRPHQEGDSGPKVPIPVADLAALATFA